MNPMSAASGRRPSRWLTLGAVVAAALLAAGCGEKKEPAATQTAAKVNKNEITVHQINFVLQQQRNLRPEQADAASRQVLERLIDQELAVQKAEDLRIDRDPRVVQQLEAAKREILARAYLERVGEAAVKPTPEEVQKYYDEKPALFSQRRIYTIQEIAIEARPDQVPGLREKLGASRNVADFVEALKAEGFKFQGNQAVRAAEQLPLNSLDAFARMQDGQATLIPNANGAQVIVLAGSRMQPVSLDQARPAIEQFILNDRKRKLVDDDVKQLRASAAIQYVGKFAEAAASAPAGAAPAAAADPAPAPTAAPAAPASAGLTGSEVSRGLGLK
jgi:EpsD family peptidyl-prolyl cis-trans isomerase